MLHQRIGIREEFKYVEKIMHLRFPLSVLSLSLHNQ